MTSSQLALRKRVRRGQPLVQTCAGSGETLCDLFGRAQRVDLRRFTPDPGLFDYLSLSEAIEAVVCPYLLVGDVLVVAAAEPDPSLQTVTEFFPSLAIVVVQADQGAILAALARVAGGGRR